MTQARKDASTVTQEGARKLKYIEGVTIRSAVTHPDERGTLTEIFNPAWGVHDAPLVYIYQFTIRPRTVKGWVKHLHQDDRLFVSQGIVKFVLYDDRPESPTYKMVNEIFVSEYNRALVMYPPNIYHALQNVGDKDALIINMPTRAYDHENPDKYRLPVNNDLIPYVFEDKLGG